MVDFTKSIRINLNMNQNELQEVVIQSLATAPIAKKVGYIYFNSDKKKFGVCVDATAGKQKWEYMSDAADVAAALEALKKEMTVTRIANATGIQQGDGESAVKIFFDGLVTSIEPAEDNGKEGEEKVAGHFLKLTKTGTEGKPSEVSYIDMPETVEKGELDNENKKIVLTYSDGSTKDISLAAIYDAIASKTVSVAETSTVKLNSAVDETTKAQTLSADVKLSSDANNAISKVEDVKNEDGKITTAGGLLVKKVTDLATAEDAELGNLATGNAVVNALKNEKFAATAERYGVIKLATSAEAIEGSNESNAITPKVLHDAIKKNIQGGVTYVGVLPSEEDFSGAEKGDLFLVNSDKVTFAETELHKGDYVLFHSDASDITSAKGAFDVINSELSEDVVRLGATQTLTNKTIDATNNTISNLKMTNLADTVADYASTEKTDEQKAAAKIASEAKVQELIDAGVKAVKVDGTTIARAEDGTLSVKEGGLEVKHMKDNAVASEIAADAVNTKLATEKAVRDLHNGIPAETMTFTNKTFNANGDGNTLSNVETEDFAEGVIVKAKGEGETGGIADTVANASDDKLATEKAIAEALAAIKASATSAHSIALDKAKWEMHADGDSAEYTVTLSTDLGVSAEHKVSIAKLLDNSKNEVEGLISYNTENGTVIFKINCTEAPENWTALIVC